MRLCISLVNFQFCLSSLTNNLFIYVDHVCLIELRKERCSYFSLWCKHPKDFYTNLVVLAVAIGRIAGIRLGIRNSGLGMECTEEQEEN